MCSYVRTLSSFALFSFALQATFCCDLLQLPISPTSSSSSSSEKVTVSKHHPYYPPIMSGVNKEAPVVEETTTPTTTSTEPKSESATATPSQVDAATPLEAVKDAAASAVNAVSDKATKIFGSFTSTATETPTESKESTPAKPLFGGFSSSSGASAWTAPSTIGGFGSASSFTPKKETSKDDEEVGLLSVRNFADGYRKLVGRKLLKVQTCILNL
jgi:hypothetical protein